jgi:hypothetical protein
MAAELQRLTAAFPPLSMGECACFAPQHTVCPRCAARRPALDKLVTHIVGILTTRLHSPGSPQGKRSAQASNVAAAEGAAATAGTAALLKPHVWALLCRQVRHLYSARGVHSAVKPSPSSPAPTDPSPSDPSPTGSLTYRSFTYRSLT